MGLNHFIGNIQKIKKQSEYHFIKGTRELRNQYFWDPDKDMNFFDKVLTNKESVDYVVQNLA
jgi:hypothetical protein